MEKINGAPPDVVRLVIEVSAQNGVTVSGPIHDKILCFGLLECAKDAVRDHITRQVADKRVIPVSHIAGVN